MHKVFKNKAQGCSTPLRLLPQEQITPFRSQFQGQIMKFHPFFTLKQGQYGTLKHLYFKIPRTHANLTLFQHFKDKAYYTEQEKNSSQNWYQVRNDICSCDLSGER